MKVEFEKGDFVRVKDCGESGIFAGAEVELLEESKDKWLVNCESMWCCDKQDWIPKQLLYI